MNTLLNNTETRLDSVNGRRQVSQATSHSILQRNNVKCYKNLGRIRENDPINFSINIILLACMCLFHSSMFFQESFLFTFFWHSLKTSGIS